jgi:hypothetical protein
VEFRNSGRSPDKTSKLRKGSGVDGKARGSREKWKWIGSPLTEGGVVAGRVHSKEHKIK